MSRRRRHKTHEIVLCYRASDNLEEQEEYHHTVPISSAELDYQGQKLKVNIEQINYLRKLTDGEHSLLLIANIEGQPNIQMTIQNLDLSNSREGLVSPADLATIGSLNFKNCPYIIGYYGAMLEKDSLQLCLCMESMDASMEDFYKTLHSLDNLTNVVEWKHILCRLINNIASALNFLTINGINYQSLKTSTILVNRQAVFKLCDIGIKKDSYSEAYPRPQLFYYYSSAIALKDAGYEIHPGMWTFGLNLLEILSGQYPFFNMFPYEYVPSISTWTPTFPSNQIDLEEIQQIIIKLLKLHKQEQPQNYTEILEIQCIKDVTEKASNNEIDFVARTIDKIPLEFY